MSSPTSAPTPAVVPSPAAAAIRGDTTHAVSLYRAIFANSTDAIAIIDTAGRYLEQNPAHARLLGYSAEQLQGRTPAVHLGDEAFASVAQELARTGHCRREVRSRACDGRMLDLELSAFAVRDDQGTPICYVGIKRDLSHERRATEELARRYDQLDAMYRMAAAVARAPELDTVYEEALTALQDALRVERAAVLLFDADGVMRFKASRGLSLAYRAAVEGHSPWSPDTLDPEPIAVEDVEKDPSLAAFAPVFAAEGIRALAFLPLVAEGRLLGKFMLYFGAPHQLHDEEVRLARTLASHIAVAIVRRHAEHALRESENRYRRLVEVCPVGVLVHREGRVVFANPAVSRLLGAADPTELLGRDMLDIVHPDFHAISSERTQRLRAGASEAPPVEKRFIRLDGSAVDVEVSKIGFTWEGRPAVQMVVRDITERRRTEQARQLLFEAGATLAASLDHETTLRSVARLAVPALADWCFVDLLDADGGFHRLAVAHANPDAQNVARALQRHYDARPDSVGGAARVTSTGRPELVSHVRESAVAAPARDPEHLELLRAMGPVSYMCVPLIAHGRTLGAMSFVACESGRRYGPADLTLAEELGRGAALAVDNARLYREAHEANRAKSQFLATMSHELRTPLNAIAGYTELLEMEVHGVVTPEQREDLRRIRINQRHLLGLINDVLSFARLETGRFEFDIDDVPVEDTLAAARAHVEPQIRARALRYAYQGGDRTITCRADRDKLQQIVVNLLSNAVKFTPPGGNITLEWEADDDRVVIRVRDTGRGIPRDRLEAIFEPFVQLDTGFSARMEGTGLGLAISRELARAMRGDVRVESEVGKGSTFTVVVPRT